MACRSSARSLLFCKPALGEFLQASFGGPLVGTVSPVGDCKAPEDGSPGQKARTSSVTALVFHVTQHVISRSCRVSGKFTKEIDKALPGKHTKALYDHFSREEAAILVQLRTNKCKLNGYLAKINASATDLCECGQSETVSHFLIECPKWETQRQALKQAAGTRWTDVSYLLGGWNDNKKPDGTYVDGARKKWRPNQKVVAATIAFAKNTKRQDFGRIEGRE